MTQPESKNTGQPPSDVDESATWIPCVDRDGDLSDDDENQDGKQTDGPSFLQRLKSWLLWGAIGLIGVMIQLWLMDDGKTSHSRPAVAPIKEQTQYNPDAEQHRIQELQATLENSVRSYLEAKSVKEKLRWIRDPERVKPLMKKYYAHHAITPKQFKGIQSQRPVSIWSRSFTILNATLENDETHFLTAEYTPSNLVKIDWETDMHYQPISWKEFIQSKPNTIVDMRVYCKPDHFYAFEFSDSSERECFRLVSRDNKKAVFGYVRRGSPVWEDLRKFYTGRRKSREDGEPLLLRLHVPLKGSAKTGVIIEKFLSDRWLMPPTD